MSKKITQFQTLTNDQITDDKLMVLGDPTSGLLYKPTVLQMKTVFGSTGNEFDFNPGSVLFGDVDGLITEDFGNFFYDATNKRLGIGTNLPSQMLHLENGNGLINGGAFTVQAGLSSSSVRIIQPVNAGFVRFITIDQTTATILLANGNTDASGGGISRSSNNLGELRIFSSQTIFGGNPSSFITMYTNGSEKARLNINGWLGIGTTNPAAQLDIASTTTGALLPRMTTTQRDAIGTLTEGLEIYNLTTHTKNYYNGTTWKEITAS